MKRFQSILCASLLTFSLSSAALAGNISGKDGNISGAPGNISGAPTTDGNISGRDGNISGIAGNISGFTDEAYSVLLSLFGAVLP
jgi:hypothetical protein